MLILTRRVDETIVIGDDIYVTILRIDGGGQVRIGIKAPNNVRVNRQEIHERIIAEQQAQYGK